MSHKAYKTIIITERLIADKVTDIVESLGASGYTIVNAGGKGSRGVRRADRASVIDDFSNVKIEIITNQKKLAVDIAETVAEKFFKNYSGITYVEDVNILRPEKF